MPANFKVDQAATFANMILLSCNPKMAFGSQTDQEMTKGDNPLPKWEVEVAAGFHQFGKIVNEVLKIGVASRKNPTDGITPYSPVQMIGFELGVMEKRSKDGASVLGFQVWYRAEEVRSTAVPSHKAS